ncbi:MAG: hypothetical protein QME42_03915 [bacterium]|nr:hypothetical protein [bacterium]MDI6735333.1 hypothetical protein [bacterium]
MYYYEAKKTQPEEREEARIKTMKQSKAYPYLKATLEALIGAAPGWAKAPAKFVSSLSEQLKDKPEEEIKQLEQEIKGISKDETVVSVLWRDCRTNPQ